MSCCGGVSHITGENTGDTAAGGDPNNVVGDLNVDGDICLPATKKLKIGATTYEEEKIVYANASTTITNTGELSLTPSSHLSLVSTGGIALINGNQGVEITAPSNFIRFNSSVVADDLVTTNSSLIAKQGVNIDDAVDNGALLQVKNNRLTEIGTDSNGEHYVCGTAWEYMDDLASKTTAETISQSDTGGKPILNDGLGPATVRNQRPLSGHAFWDSGTSKFWPEISGDCYTLSLRATVKSSSNTGSMTLRLNIADTLYIDLGTLNFTDMDPHNVVKTTAIFAGDLFVANGGELEGVGITGQGDTDLTNIQMLITRTHRGRPPVEPPFVPTDLLGLKGWYDDTGHLTDGGGVTTWTDRSTASSDLSWTDSQPQVGTQNARPTLLFSAGDKMLSATGGTASPLLTVFVVLARTGGSYALCGGDLATGDWYVSAGGSGSDITYLTTIGQEQVFHAHGTTTTPVLHSYTVDTLQGIGYNGGVPGSTKVFTGTTGALPTQGLFLGTFRGSAASNFVGDMCEIVLYNRVLSIDEHNEVGEYLATKWGLSWTTIV